MGRVFVCGKPRFMGVRGFCRKILSTFFVVGLGASVSWAIPLNTETFIEQGRSLLWGLHNFGQNVRYQDGSVLPGVFGVDVNSFPAWSVTTGEGSLIALVDSGVDLTHPAYAANLLRDDEGLIVGINTIATENTRSAQDLEFHGTNIASILVGNGDVAPTMGVAPNSKLLPIRSYQAFSGSNSFSDRQRHSREIAEGIIFAVDHGADVINLSRTFHIPNGLDENPFPELKNAIAHARDNGVILVNSAGNTSFNLSENENGIKVVPPAWGDELDNIITVGAHNNLGEKTEFSSYDAQLVHLFAPGDSNFVAFPQEEGNIRLPHLEGRIFSFNKGTSLAAPHVAGAVALARSLCPGLHYQVAKRAILETVQRIDVLEGYSASGGILNVGSLVLRLEENTCQ